MDNKIMIKILDIKKDMLKVIRKLEMKNIEGMMRNGWNKCKKWRRRLEWK